LFHWHDMRDDVTWINVAFHYHVMNYIGTKVPSF
jgi:hypothetical protein